MQSTELMPKDTLLSKVNALFEGPIQRPNNNKPARRSFDDLLQDRAALAVSDRMLRRAG